VWEITDNITSHTLTSILNSSPFHKLDWSPVLASQLEGIFVAPRIDIRVAPGYRPPVVLQRGIQFLQSCIHTRCIGIDIDIDIVTTCAGTGTGPHTYL